MANIEDIIDLTERFSESKNISKIINLCSLQPEKVNGLNPVKRWIDPFGLKLVIKKSKLPIIDLCGIKKAIDKDLYSGLTLDNCLKITKKICIIYGQDDCIDSKFIYYSCYCIDNKIRSYFNYNNKIKRCSSLYLNYNILSSFIDSIDKKGQIKIKSNILKMNSSENLIIDDYPMSKKLDL